MYQRALTKWFSTLEEVRVKLVKGAEKLDMTVMMKDNKNNTREALANTIISIVNCGHELAKYLSDKQKEADNYKKTCVEKTEIISGFSEGFKEMKDTMN